MCITGPLLRQYEYIPAQAMTLDRLQSDGMHRLLEQSSSGALDDELMSPPAVKWGRKYGLMMTVDDGLRCAPIRGTRHRAMVGSERTHCTRKHTKGIAACPNQVVLGTWITA